MAMVNIGTIKGNYIIHFTFNCFSYSFNSKTLEIFLGYGSKKFEFNELTSNYGVIDTVGKELI